MDENDDVSRLDGAIKELLEIEKSLFTKHQLRLIGTVIQSTVCFLMSAANSADGKNRIGKFQEHSDWQNLITNINRFFYSHLHTAIELGLEIYCESKNVKVEPSALNRTLKRYDEIAQGIPEDRKESLRGFIKEIVYNKPQFADYLESAFKLSKFEKQERKFFRTFFNALSVLRNKSSHSNIVLSDADRAKITEAELHFFLSENGELQADPRIQPHITKMVVIFFEHLN